MHDSVIIVDIDVQLDFLLIIASQFEHTDEIQLNTINSETMLAGWSYV